LSLVDLAESDFFHQIQMLFFFNKRTIIMSKREFLRFGALLLCVVGLTFTGCGEMTGNAPGDVSTGTSNASAVCNCTACDCEDCVKENCQCTECDCSKATACNCEACDCKDCTKENCQCTECDCNKAVACNCEACDCKDCTKEDCQCTECDCNKEVASK